MRQPEGFVALDKEHCVCHLKKFLYGLKQVPRQWYKRFDSFMIGQCYPRSLYDCCVYFQQFPRGFFHLLAVIC